MVDYTPDDFQKVQADVHMALKDASLTEGATIRWKLSMLVAANLSSDEPLSSVWADDLGRLWKERHSGGENALICILDTRKE